MSRVFYFHYNGVRTSWNGSLKTFMNYPKDKQLHLLYALECAPAVEKDRVRANIALKHKNCPESEDMMAFIRSGAMNKPAPEVSIVACVLASLRGDPCSICLEGFSDVRQMAVATNCRHVFCRDCIVKWASKSRTCPVCRSSTEKALIHLGERDAGIAEEIIRGPTNKGSQTSCS